MMKLQINKAKAHQKCQIQKQVPRKLIINGDSFFPVIIITLDTYSIAKIASSIQIYYYPLVV